MDHVLVSTGCDILAAKCNTQEEKDPMYNSSKSEVRFDNWEKDLVEFGFTEVAQDLNVCIPNNQLMRILNVDETCLAHDGGTGWRGGKPTIIYCRKNFPEVGKAVAKSSIIMTMIAGSTVAGEAIPPHFRFLTMAQSEETMQLQTDIQYFIPYIQGPFGGNDKKNWPITFGMNAKNGMDD